MKNSRVQESVKYKEMLISKQKNIFHDKICKYSILRDKS